MRKIYFTVGPSQVYPTLYQHMQEALASDIPSLNHRGKEFKELLQNTYDNLRKLLNIPSDHQIFFVSSALESMERTIQSCVEKSSYHVITGAFGKAWADYSSMLGKEVIRQEAQKEQEIDLVNLTIPKQAELICITQNDTSTGVWLPVEDIYKLKTKYPNKLVVIDTVSSVPYVDINFKYIDIAFFSVQKGFGLPAGLAVIIISPQALKKTEELFKKGINIGSYHSFKNLSEKAANLQTPETPNVLDIYLLNLVIKDMLKIGVKNIREEINQKAKIIYDFFYAHKKYSVVVKNPKFQSPTTLVFDVKGESENLRKRLAKKGFILGAGYGDNSLTQIRIANFPSHTLESVKLMLKHTESE